MQKYIANLSLQAQVPENQLLATHFKQSIEFNILCPVSGCKEIKANGFHIMPKIIRTITTTGDSLSITIPKDLTDLGFGKGEKVELSVEDNKLVIRPHNVTWYDSTLLRVIEDKDSMCLKPIFAESENKSITYGEINDYGDRDNLYFLYFNHNIGKYLLFARE